MRVRLAASILGLAIVTTGCYHATIDTGLPATGQVVTKKWASAWIYGLVPPATIETAAKCPNGVARVETQLSFVNQVVSILTWGIYTPMQIIVTCGDKSKAELIPGTDRQIEVPAGASRQQVQEAFGAAASQSRSSHQPVYVRFGE